MAERRKNVGRKSLGKGISALIPPQDGPGSAPAKRAGQPIDVFFGGAALDSAPIEDAAERTDEERGLTETPGTETTAAAPEPDLVPVPGAVFRDIPVDSIAANSKQPRTVFDEDDLAELADSITEVGLLQPIVVRQTNDQSYELIMGERRWRASMRAGLETIPAIVRDTSDDDLLRDALLENLHRVELNPLEEASAYQQLLDDFGCTQEELSRRIARSRPQISNTLRLLKLPPLVQRRVAAGVLSAGHARALLGLTDPAAMERLAQRIVAEGLSVRAVEEIVALGDEPRLRAASRTSHSHPELQRLSQDLSDRLDTRVKVKMGARKGTMTVDFGSIEDLNRILSVLSLPVDGVADQQTAD